LGAKNLGKLLRILQNSVGIVAGREFKKFHLPAGKNWIN
jgi:hypothetical protein